MVKGHFGEIRRRIPGMSIVRRVRQQGCRSHRVRLACG